jgi:hypothetical protein
VLCEIPFSEALNPGWEEVDQEEDDMQLSNPSPDYQEHVQTYRSFVRGVAIFVAHAAIILILMAYFLVWRASGSYSCEAYKRDPSILGNQGDTAHFLHERWAMRELAISIMFFVGGITAAIAGDWNRYANDRFGFSLSYPSDASIISAMHQLASGRAHTAFVSYRANPMTSSLCAHLDLLRIPKLFTGSSPADDASRLAA